jgi:hypothetical protein
LSVVLNGCETWSHIARGKHKLKVCENRVLRRMYGTLREELTGCWGKLHNKELHNLHSSTYIIEVK